MNSVIETFLNHRSIRSYLDQPVEEEKIDLILKSALAAPTSINGQQLSVIVIKDKVKKAEIARLAGDQKWIDEAPVFLLFVMDFTRAKWATEKNNEVLKIHESLESIMVGSVDVGIAMGSAIGAAESMGLGIVPIGGVRRNPEEMIRLFNLPELVYPVVGLVVGYPNEMPMQKPRIPMSIFRHEEVYQADQSEALEAYDDLMSKYMKERTAGESDRNWSKQIAAVYKHVYYPKVYPTMKEQGFDNDK